VVVVVVDVVDVVVVAEVVDVQLPVKVQLVKLVLAISVVVLFGVALVAAGSSETVVVVDVPLYKLKLNHVVADVEVVVVVL
jgi:hypothetical protein